MLVAQAREAPPVAAVVVALLEGEYELRAVRVVFQDELRVHRGRRRAAAAARGQTAMRVRRGRLASARGGGCAGRSLSGRRRSSPPGASRGCTRVCCRLREGSGARREA